MLPKNKLIYRYLKDEADKEFKLFNLKPLVMRDKTKDFGYLRGTSYYRAAIAVKAYRQDILFAEDAIAVKGVGQSMLHALVTAGIFD